MSKNPVYKKYEMPFNHSYVMGIAYVEGTTKKIKKLGGNTKLDIQNYKEAKNKLSFKIDEESYCYSIKVFCDKTGIGFEYFFTALNTFKEFYDIDIDHLIDDLLIFIHKKKKDMPVILIYDTMAILIAPRVDVESEEAKK
jgi:hypothetical protein